MKLELEPEKLRKMLRFCLVAVLLLIIGLLIGFTISRSNRMDGFQKIENADLADEYVLDGNDLNPSQASQGGTKSSASSKKTSSNPLKRTLKAVKPAVRTKTMKRNQPTALARPVRECHR